MSLIVLFTGAVNATIVAPAGDATASAVASVVSAEGAPLIVVAPAHTATATMMFGLLPLNTRFPTGVLLPEGSTGLPTITVAPAAAAVTAASSEPVVRATAISPVGMATIERGVPVVAVIIVDPARTVTGSAVAPTPLVSPLATPAANVRAEQLRLISPTGQPEPGYANVTLRQLV